MSETRYLLDYVGPGIHTIPGIGQFGSDRKEAVVRDERGELVLNPDGSPQTKSVAVHFGPHPVSASIAAQYATEANQALGWVVRTIDAPDTDSPPAALLDTLDILAPPTDAA